MVSDHTLKLEIRAQLKRHSAIAAQQGIDPLSYTQVREWVISRMLPSLEELTPLRQEQVAAGIAALDSGRDLIICGGAGSGKSTIAQAVANRSAQGVYISISPDYLEFGKELRRSKGFIWEPERANQVRAARSICIDEIRGGEDHELLELVKGKPLAVVNHADSPESALRHLELLHFHRNWNNPVILYCASEDRFTDEQRQELRERRARAHARLDNIPPIVNG